MAYKIKLPSTSLNQPVSQSNNDNDQSTIQSVVSQITRPLSRAYETVQSLPRTASNILTYLPNKAVEYATGTKDFFGIGEDERFPSYEQSRKNTTEFLEKYLGKGSNEPHNKVEKVIDAVAATLPFAILTGGTSAIPGAAASAASGEVARQGAEGLGFGPLGQTIADIGGSFGYNFLQKGATPGKIRQLGTRKYKKDYMEAEKIAPKVNVFKEVSPVVNDINKEIDILRGGNSRLEREVAQKITNELSETNHLLNKPKVTLMDVWDKKKHLGQLMDNADDKIVKDFYKRAIGSLNDNLLYGKSAESSGFSKFYSPAEDLFKSVNVPSTLGRILENSTKLENILSNPIATLTLVGTSIIGAGPTKTALAIPATFGLRYLTRSYDFVKRPEAQKLWRQIAEEALSNNIPALTKSLTQYNDLADEYVKENPIKKTYQINWKK